MADLLDSQGISGDNAQLLAAVGVETLAGLSQSDPGGLLEELETANSHLGLVEQLPNLDQVVTRRSLNIPLFHLISNDVLKHHYF